MFGQIAEGERIKKAEVLLSLYSLLLFISKT